MYLLCYVLVYVYCVQYVVYMYCTAIKGNVSTRLTDYEQDTIKTQC